MSNYAPPSSDPADDDSLAGVLRTALRKFLQQTDDLLPAQVLAFDRAKNRATVVPLVHVVTTDGRAVPRAQVASVPVLQAGGGGVVLLFNLKPGDLGWIKASDRDISTFLQAGRASPPNTQRMHSFQDGVFIPDVMRGWTLAGEDADNAVLQTKDGATKIALGTDHIKLAAGGASVTVTPTGTTIVGGLTIDGIVFGTHVHDDPQGGTVSPPHT